MLGLLLIIVVSWALLSLIEKQNITVLGMVPTVSHMVQFTVGLVFIILISLMTIYLESMVLDIDWVLQSKISCRVIFEAIIYHFKSALTEDLVFRGAILYILIKRLGAPWALLVSALCFGVYHVFSYGMIGGRVIPIVYVIVVTGFAGYVWAYAFYKTSSIMMALGFHLGVNLINACFFENEPYGELIFTEISRTPISEWPNLLLQIVKGVLPSILTLIFVKLILKYHSKTFQINNVGDESH
ncbi:MAG: CPBP family intramembrane metalloprotease [Algicola sp.]|nr:CPBP family intramembrane metalloprotease [Algicola sp.]